MFGAEVRSMLFEVITSWQVLAVTIVIILYFFLVSYVARFHTRRPRKITSPKKKEKKVEEEIIDENDELGLEETSKD